MNPAVVQRTVLRWSGLLVLTAAIGAASAFGVSMLMSERYEAQAVLLVGSLTVTDPSEQLGYRQLADTYSSLVRTPLVLGTVIGTLGLDESIREVSERVDASNPDDGSIIQIRATGGTSAEAAALAQAVATRVAQISVGTAVAGDGLAVIIEPAAEPTSPASPRMVLNIAVGAALGLMVGLLIFYLAYSRRAATVPPAPGWGPEVPATQVPPPRRS